jgi:hypothetical protein
MTGSGAERRGFWTPATIVVVVAAVLLLLIAMYFAALATGLGVCGGDGGSPYAAPASPRGRFCDSGATSLILWGPPLVLLIGVPIAVSRGSRAILALAFAIAVAVAFAPLVVAGSLSKECGAAPSDASYREQDEFLRGHPECAHY